MSDQSPEVLDVPIASTIRIEPCGCGQCDSLVLALSDEAGTILAATALPWLKAAALRDALTTCLDATRPAASPAEQPATGGPH